MESDLFGSCMYGRAKCVPIPNAQKVQKSQVGTEEIDDFFLKNIFSVASHVAFMAAWITDISGWYGEPALRSRLAGAH